jgi:hypothetical protein
MLVLDRIDLPPIGVLGWRANHVRAHEASLCSASVDRRNDSESGRETQYRRVFRKRIREEVANRSAQLSLRNGGRSQKGVRPFVHR